MNQLKNVTGNAPEVFEDQKLPFSYRAYKNTPHRPESLMLKYAVHRLENVDKYGKGKDVGLDNAFLQLHQQGGAYDKNGHIQVDDLHQGLAANPQWMKDLVDHKNGLNNMILEHLPEAVDWIDGEPHIKLTRGLNTDKEDRGPDHALASYADVPHTGFGSIMHHQYVPLKNVWYSFDHGPNGASSEKFGPENEWLVSQHPIKYIPSGQPITHQIAERNSHQFSVTPRHQMAVKLASGKINQETVDEVFQKLNLDGMNRLLVNKNPLVSPKHLDTAINSSYNMAAVAKHPNLSVENITRFLKRGNSYYKDLLFSHPNINEDHISMGLADTDINVKRAAIRHPKANANHIWYALKSGDAFLATEAMYNPNITPEHISEALLHREKAVRQAAIMNKKATTEHINMALDDSDNEVKRLAAVHPNATPENIEKALKSDDSRVASAALKNPNFPSEQIERELLKEDLGDIDKTDFMSHPSMKGKLIDNFLNGDYKFKTERQMNKAISYLFSFNRNLQPKHIDIGLDQKDDIIREYAAKNPNASPENIEKALKDTSQFVREAAARNKNITKEQLQGLLKSPELFLRSIAMQRLGNSNYKDSEEQKPNKEQKEEKLASSEKVIPQKLSKNNQYPNITNNRTNIGSSMKTLRSLIKKEKKSKESLEKQGFMGKMTDSIKTAFGGQSTTTTPPPAQTTPPPASTSPTSISGAVTGSVNRAMGKDEMKISKQSFNPSFQTGIINPTVNKKKKKQISGTYMVSSGNMPQPGPQGMASTTTNISTGIGSIGKEEMKPMTLRKKYGSCIVKKDQPMEKNEKQEKVIKAEDFVNEFKKLPKDQLVKSLKEFAEDIKEIEQIQTNLIKDELKQDFEPIFKGCGPDKAKMKSCVNQVKAKGKVNNPYAVCVDSIKKEELEAIVEKHGGVIPDGHEDKPKMLKHINRLYRKGFIKEAQGLYRKYISKK
jgi:hypothetical protein